MVLVDRPLVLVEARFPRAVSRVLICVEPLDDWRCRLEAFTVPPLETGPEKPRLRGELAFMRFLRLKRMTELTRDPATLRDIALGAADEPRVDISRLREMLGLPPRAS